MKNMIVVVAALAIMPYGNVSYAQGGLSTNLENAAGISSQLAGVGSAEGMHAGALEAERALTGIAAKNVKGGVAARFGLKGRSFKYVSNEGDGGNGEVPPPDAPKANRKGNGTAHGVSAVVGAALGLVSSLQTVAAYQQMAAFFGITIGLGEIIPFVAQNVAITTLFGLGAGVLGLGLGSLVANKVGVQSDAGVNRTRILGAGIVAGAALGFLLGTGVIGGAVVGAAIGAGGVLIDKIRNR